MERKKMGLLSCFSLAFLGFLIAGPFPGGVGAPSCPRGWLFHSGRCYVMVPYKESWAEAELDCQSRGRNGHLASITSQKLGQLLAKLSHTYMDRCSNVWIGLRVHLTNKRWEWADKSPVKYTAWEPSGSNKSKFHELCTELTCISGYVHWNEAYCKKELFYICQVDS